jgi:signal transduction histidine kinase
MLQITIPSLGVPILYAFTTGFVGITTLKVFIVYASFIIVIGTFTSVYVRREFSKILARIELPLSSFTKKSSLMSRMRYQIIPLIIVALMFTSLVGYSVIINTSSESYYKYYKTKLSDILEDESFYSVSEVNTMLKGLEQEEPDKTIYIMYPDYTYHDTNGVDITDKFSDFWKKYTKEFSIVDDSVVYDYYGFDIRGVLVKVNIAGQDYYAGIKYELTSYPALISLGISMLSLFILNLFTLHFTSNSLAEEIQSVSKGMRQIVAKSKYNDSLPVTSNDEIGELVVSFNEVQSLSKAYISEIQNSQTMLIERERLASLGQMIGGIAHNLKTPIMSISGAAEGLTDLISEYVASIENPIVTKEDHKEIAKDMLSWVTKIKTHTSYMSDIITTVKGQASQLSTSNIEAFSVYDLSKRVDILMKHELKHANVELQITIECDPTLKIAGDINSLIQVINNLIGNAIQSYNGEIGKQILFNIYSDDQFVYFKVADEGCGIDDDTKEKLFKEMYTTKGKNGTGLGLYMSYSTIKGNFNGDITFESTLGKGSVFTVKIPLK